MSALQNLIGYFPSSSMLTYYILQFGSYRIIYISIKLNFLLMTGTVDRLFLSMLFKKVISLILIKLSD